eukprot:CAMPEP_0113592712 /NCGR_PEP_ID=MMETSP0015_2-20120614/38003_1 /TAXON_ID=2838 /ORGANISM="Odontella" /LENGTH=685 /DNA_ID=CAMNT_0000499287 /DNA_START=120 /DNA_END=2178 /DNA_ORIENTATION=+ /assembly_acc=CAM_ASM_000160
MIDSLTIFSKSGAVLYHHAASDGSSSAPSSTVANGGGGDVGTRLSPREAERINSFVSAVLAGGGGFVSAVLAGGEGFNPPGGGRRTVDLPGAAGGGGTGDVAEWETGASMEGVDPDWIAVSFVPSVVARSASSSRGKSASWMRRLLRSTLKEYSLYYAARSIGGGGGDDAEGEGAIADVEREMRPPDMATFDPVFAALLKRSEVMARRKESSGVGDGAPGHEDEEDEDLVSEDEEGEGDDDDGEDETDTQANIAKMKAKRGRAARGAATQSPQKKKGKEQRVWHDGTAKITKSALAKLDRSKDHKGESGIDAAVADDSRALAEARAAYLPEEGEIMAWEEEERLDDDDYEDAGADGEGDDQASAGWGGSLRGLFEQMSGNKVLTASDLDAPLTEMHRLLASKNVATDVASEICDGVRTRLVGKKLQSFGRVKTAVRHALEASIEKLLSPKKGKDVDMLKGVVGKRERQSGGLFTSKVDNPKPYVIVMVGINGVGKSTSLAKIAYYLKLSGCNPLIAACDTFRSGAVEQLNVHAKCLDVPLFHRGYAKDPSAVATAAIEHASEEGNDVVLIDTAGRMQNNVPLMRALGKLVSSCQPDLVLFVCEALVGNDGLDQLKMFDRAFRTGGHGRAIDGIVLTKFDTVSDKVGAALTLTHESGSPIAFVGTGQKYNHLKPLSVRAVIKSLFS